jgi:dihydropteroate synthase
MKRLELVGILNMTPDSLSGDGFVGPVNALEASRQMFLDGASYIDTARRSTIRTPISLSVRFCSF